MKLFRQAYTKGSLSEKGVATLMIVTVLSLVFISISIAIARTNLVKFQSVENLKNSRRSYSLAESGVEDTMIQLIENINYQGSPSGETTPIGTYYSSVGGFGGDYTIRGSSKNGDTERIVSLNITVSYKLAEVTTKATYMADTFSIRGEGALIQGDVWTNDDFVLEKEAVVKGNISAAGKGSMAVDWVRDCVEGSLICPGQGSQVEDNPDTEGITEGNIVAADTVKIFGDTSVVTGDVTSDKKVVLDEGGQVLGDITEYANITWTAVPVPKFDFATYKQQAKDNSTYYSNQSSFITYLKSPELVDIEGNRRLPDGLYYVENGAVKIKGSPVYLDGSLVVEDNLWIHCEWVQNALNDLPALVAGLDLRIINYEDPFFGDQPGGDVTINGIVYAEKTVRLYRKFADEKISIVGAVWAGDDIKIEDHTEVIYNIDTIEVGGFDFVHGFSDLQKNYWQEII